MFKYFFDFFYDSLSFIFFAVAALLFQISGIIIWPAMNTAWVDHSKQSIGTETTYWILENSWALPLGLFLTSFGWWESFVDENRLTSTNFLWRVKINMIEEGSRYTSYLIISIWKIVLFFCMFLVLSTTVVRWIRIVLALNPLKIYSDCRDQYQRCTILCTYSLIIFLNLLRVQQAISCFLLMGPRYL